MFSFLNRFRFWKTRSSDTERLGRPAHCLEPTILNRKLDFNLEYLDRSLDLDIGNRDLTYATWDRELEMTSLTNDRELTGFKKCESSLRL